LLAQTLNRTHGADDPVAYAQLLERVLLEFDAATVAGLLPESEATIDRFLREYGTSQSDELAEPAAADAPPRSRLGEMYELGPHRLLCGDATDEEHARLVLAGESAALLTTDPPYGVELDHGWRDGVRQPRGSARAGKLAGDDRADWRPAFELTDAPIAYVWHSALHAHICREGLIAAGFELRQQIVWTKTVHALSRSAYQWAHETAWYAVRKGSTPAWKGGRKQTTVWEAASPIMPFGASDREDACTAHPTQKPLELFERPILNHTEPGAIVYDPFCGSGTSLIAAEKTGRRCIAIELDPIWCDVIRDRYQAWHDKGGE
jgi:DNA modification methylase